MVNKIRIAFQAVLICGLLVTQVVAGSNRSIEDFYGRYIGHIENGDKRDMSVVIEEADKGGFSIGWVTVIHKAGGMKRKDYSIKFQATRRPGIFSSAMKTNVFGAQTALDPLEGEPFVWARIKGDTLTVHTLLIKEDGSYEMQIYNRTLNAQGLLLEYSRLNSGEQLKQVNAQLVKVGD